MRGIGYPTAARTNVEKRDTADDGYGFFGGILDLIIILLDQGEQLLS